MPHTQVPLEVLQHIATGLARVQEGAQPPLPLDWESRARDLLLAPDNKARILALQRPVGECKAGLSGALVAALQRALALRAEAAAAAAGDAGADGAGAGLL